VVLSRKHGIYLSCFAVCSSVVDGDCSGKTEDSLCVCSVDRGWQRRYFCSVGCSHCHRHSTQSHSTIHCM